MWKVMLGGVVLALGLATKTKKTWVFRFGWATKSTAGQGENGGTVLRILGEYHGMGLVVWSMALVQPPSELGRGRKKPSMSGSWINKHQKSRKGNNGNHWEIELIQGHLCK